MYLVGPVRPPSAMLTHWLLLLLTAASMAATAAPTITAPTAAGAACLVYQGVNSFFNQSVSFTVSSAAEYYDIACGGASYTASVSQLCAASCTVPFFLPVSLAGGTNCSVTAFDASGVSSVPSPLFAVNISPPAMVPNCLAAAPAQPTLPTLSSVCAAPAAGNAVLQLNISFVPLQLSSMTLQCTAQEQTVYLFVAAAPLSDHAFFSVAESLIQSMWSCQLIAVSGAAQGPASAPFSLDLRHYIYTSPASCAVALVSAGSPQTVQLILSLVALGIGGLVCLLASCFPRLFGVVALFAMVGICSLLALLASTGMPSWSLSLLVPIATSAYAGALQAAVFLAARRISAAAFGAAAGLSTSLFLLAFVMPLVASAYSQQTTQYVAFIAMGGASVLGAAAGAFFRAAAELVGTLSIGSTLLMMGLSHFMNSQIQISAIFLAPASYGCTSGDVFCWVNFSIWPTAFLLFLVLHSSPWIRRLLPCVMLDDEEMKKGPRVSTVVEQIPGGAFVEYGEADEEQQQDPTPMKGSDSDMDPAQTADDMDDDGDQRQRQQPLGMSGSIGRGRSRGSSGSPYVAGDVERNGWMIGETRRDPEDDAMEDD